MLDSLPCCRIKMAFTGVRALRNLVKFVPRNKASTLIANSSRSKLLTTIRSLYSFDTRVPVTITSQVFTNTQRCFADDHSLEDKTLNVFKSFDKVDPTKVEIIIFRTSNNTLMVLACPQLLCDLYLTWLKSHY